MNKKHALFIIDAQKDFCEPGRPMFVEGADTDVKNIASFIMNYIDDIDYICVSLDSHQVIDISHPAFWQDANGNFPDPFTIITSSDVDSGKWSPRYYPKQAIDYLHKLEANGEFPHCIWPEHCLIGSDGAALADDISSALAAWCRKGNRYDAVAKGTNPLTEHFGVIRANVELPNFPETQLNQNLIKTLESYQNVYLTGEAKSHCVANTLKQIMDFESLAKKFVIMEDCMSNVKGFETLADPIYDKAKQMGIPFMNSIDVKL